MTTEKTYWRSLDEFQDTEEFKKFVDREFYDVDIDKPGGLDRRRFMQLMGASLALSGATACWPEEKILPLSRRPQGHVPGKTKNYASAYERDGAGVGIRATSYDGRPIKIEGNSRHPSSLGATDAIAQASILGLYDPDRSRAPVKGGGWDKLLPLKEFTRFAKGHFATLQGKSGAGLAFVSGSSSSPTMAALRRQLESEQPQAKWYEYESVSDDTIRAGSRMAFGQVLRTQLRLDKANVILCLDADPLGDHPDKLRLSRDWARGRNPESGHLNRLYSVEPRITHTGSVADDRLTLRHEQIKPFAMAVEAAVQQALGQSSGSVPTLKDARAAKWVAAVAKDLLANRGKSVVLVGRGQPAAVHALAHRLNAALGNTAPKSTVSYTAEIAAERPSHLEAIKALVADLNDGKIDTLVLLDANPVYTAPGELDFAKAMKKAKTSIHLGLYANETAKHCSWHVPQHHYLESWGDVRGFDGIVSVAQPLIAPLYASLAAAEMVALTLAGSSFDLKQAVRDTYDRLTTPAAVMPVSAGGKQPPAAGQEPAAPRSSSDPDLAAVALFDGTTKDFRQALSEGVVAGTELPQVTPTLQDFTVSAPSAAVLKASTELKNGELELNFFQDGKVYDGRYANNGWLQELPDYLTKLTWDNAALMSPETAALLDCTDEDLLDIKVGDRSIQVACSIVPGNERGSIALAIGYGRQCAGQVGGNRDKKIVTVGVDVSPLRQSGGWWAVQGASVTKTGDTYLLANSQSHFAIDTRGKAKTEERAHVLIREGELATYKKDPKFATRQDEHIIANSLFDERRYDTANKWGMAIDLSLCTGCNSCVTACQAENNIPIVGKEQVAKGREMHWLRIDRYFKGKPEDAALAAQPMACQQCELAPCEQVCPVGATMHNADGINDMVYNRCIGTRYCLNNCPMKVRRFNYFNFHENLKNDDNKVLRMANNPEVTVRMRGVMEKCNYCMQRIQGAKAEARIDGRTVRDGDVQVACAQACPTKAIVFGDLNSKQGDVARMHRLKRVYTILPELNLQQRTKYLARITNPNPALAGV